MTLDLRDREFKPHVGGRVNLKKIRGVKGLILHNKWDMGNEANGQAGLSGSPEVGKAAGRQGALEHGESIRESHVQRKGMV